MKVLRGQYILIFSMFVSLFIMLSSNFAYAAAPMDENFDSAGVGDKETQSYTLNGITYKTNDNGGLNINIVDDGNIASGGDLALGYRSSGVNNTTQVSFITSDGSEFKLNSFVISTGLGDMTVTIKGYRNNSEVASGSITTTSFTTFNVSANSSWENIDEVRMTGADLDIDIDDIDFSPAVLSTHNVTYDVNNNTGGSVPTDGNSYSGGDTVEVLGNTGSLVKTGYTFVGWNTAANGSGISYTGGDTFSMGSSDVTLYAKWTAVDYTVTYDGNTNTGGSAPTDSNTYNITDTVTVLGNTGSLVKTGYTFAGWNTAANGSGISYTNGDTFAMGSSNVILYARWLNNNPPDAPQISSITQDLGASGFDGITKDQTLMINGTAEANSTVQVYKDSISIGTTTANSSGNWSFDYTGTSLAEGTYILTANATDSEGNTGELSDGFTVIIDTTPPAPPVILSIGDDTGVYTDDGITKDNTLIFSGMAEANSYVNIFNADTYDSWGISQTNGVENWSVNYSNQTLSSGIFNIIAHTTDVAGNQSALSATYSFTIDTTAPGINNLSPLDNAENVVTDDNFIITFSENVYVGTGNITIRNSSDNSLVETIAVTGVNVTGNGTNTITIDPSNTLDSGTAYYIQINATSFMDLAGNNFSGIADATTWNFTTEINSYTVTFEDHDGTTLKTETVEHGSGATAPTDPTREGHTFSGWDVDYSNVTEDFTVTAQYNMNQYTVTFESNGGSAINPVTVDFNSLITAPTAPTKTGYNFAGWYKDSGLTTEWNFGTDTVPASDITLYGKWTIKEYTVTFEDHDGTTLKAETVEHGSGATAPTDPTREGHNFSGWAVEYSSVTEDLTVTAQYNVNQYTVSFESNGGNAIDSITGNYCSLITAPTAPTKTGYNFAGWYKDSGLTAEWDFGTDTVPASDITLYGKWTIKEYTVTFEDHDGTTLKAETVEHGSGATAPTDPTREGHNFSGWAVEYSSVTEDLTVTAQYNVNQYTVSFESNGGSAIDSITEDYDSLITEPTALTKTGYDFASWYKDSGLTTEWDFGTDTIPASDITLYGKWIIKEYTVTFEDYDGTELKTETVEHGSVATAPSDPTREGHTFLNWSEAYDNITNNLTVRAVYDAITHQVSFQNYDSTVINTQSVEEGQSATAPTDPIREGHTFAGWDVDYSNVTEDLTVTAEYNVNRYTVRFESNGGSAIDSITEDYDSLITEPTVPTKTGYDFAGWYKDSGLTTAWDFGTDTIPALEITLYGKWNRISSGGSSGGSSSNSNSESSDDEAGSNEQEDSTIVIVNGKEEKAGIESVTEESGEKVVEVKVDSDIINKKIEEVIRNQSKDSGETQLENIIEVPILAQGAKKMTTVLTGDIVKKMDENNFNLSIVSDAINYVIPAKEVGIENVAQNLGVEADQLKEIEVEVRMNKVDKEVSKEIELRAKANNYEVVFSPVSFEVIAKTRTTSGEEKQLMVSKFNQYVQRVMKLPEGVDSSKITTGIVYNEDGTFSHVPTSVFMKDGIYYAKINSLTNSSYSAIWNPVIVKSVENHWSKEAVNDMASRLVIKNPEMFIPNQEITRGEFAEFITKALGIFRTGVTKTQNFSDVETSHELVDAIQIAAEYGIISGYPDGSFKPSARISREEAMVMYSRAMDIAGLEEVNNDRIESYIDKDLVASWAYNDVKKTVSAGVFNGKTNETINPKDTFTCAEAATAIRNLLVASGLIND